MNAARDDIQRGIVSFLLQPRSYPHDVSRVEHIETHISHLFLTGMHAYKLKKAVQFDFLDFSTMQKRQHFCVEEVRLNSRFSPDLYEAVVPISFLNGRFNLGSAEAAEGVVDYVVKMKQFDNRYLFDTLARNGALTHKLLHEITEVIAKFHHTAQPTPDYWGSADVRRVIRQNFEICRRFVPDTIAAEALRRAEQRSEECCFALESLLHKRQTTHVRAVHGDLHLKNMCVYDGQARLFDGIEFNPSLSNCDVWADLAFFLMDLVHREREADAALVWDDYLQHTDDFEGLELLNLYMSYRAAVRAKVSCLSLESAEGSPERKRLTQEAADYLDLALYSLRETRGKIIAIGGLSGSGKSTLASHLAQKLSAVHIRSDAVRKHIAGVPLFERAPPESYSEELNIRTYRGLLERATHVLRSGRTAIIDAVFHAPQWRSEVQTFAAHNQVEFLGLWCRVSPKIAGERVRTRLNDISDADEAIVSRQQTYNLGDLAWQQVDSSGSPAETLSMVLPLV